jgi:hypothetical protein
MSRTDDRADKTLPVTAEVGDEGGSYADPTIQADTFAGPFGNRRVDPQRVQPAPPDGTAPAVQAGDDAGATPGDEIRHATEPPGKTG